MSIDGLIIILLLPLAIFGGYALIKKNSNPQQTSNIQDSQAMNTTKFCPNCGAEVNPNAVVCVHCGCAISSRIDVPSVGLNIISFLFPIIGLILYIVYHQNSPKKANAIGKWALISFGINIVLLILLSAF